MFVFRPLRSPLFGCHAASLPVGRIPSVLFFCGRKNRPVDHPRSPSHFTHSCIIHSMPICLTRQCCSFSPLNTSHPFYVYLFRLLSALDVIVVFLRVRLRVSLFIYWSVYSLIRDERGGLAPHQWFIQFDQRNGVWILRGTSQFTEVIHSIQTTIM